MSPAAIEAPGERLLGTRPGGADRFDLLAAGALAALAWAFYAAALGLWFTNDDFFQLHFVLVHSHLSYLVRPAVWQQLPFQMVTPLLFASFDLDLSLFGLAPRGFYVHQLLVVCLAGAAFYLLLRMWLPRWLALAGGFLLLAGPPLTASVGLIMVRHYLEGMLPAAVSTALFVHALRTPRRGRALAWALLSAGLYLAAALEKEIFVPLVLVLLVLPEGSWRERLGRALPHLAALAAYVVYRLLMLGVLVGGYGWAVRARELPRLAVLLPGHLLADLAGGRALGWTALALLGAAAVAGLVLRPGAVLPAAVATLAAVLPVLPVATERAVRYALAPWIVLVVAAVFGCQALAARRGRAGRPGKPRGESVLAAALAVAACCAAGWTARAAWARHLGELERMSEEYRFFVQAPAGSLLRNPLGPGSSFGELRWWKEELFGLARGTPWSFDDVLLCSRPLPARAVWSYDPARRRMAEVTADLPRLCRQSLAALRPRAPLAASFEETGDARLFWHLGPYPHGKYAFLLAGGAVVLPAPRDAGYQTRDLRSISLQLRYESPAGWVTYSPAFDLDLSRPMSREWHRAGS